MSLFVSVWNISETIAHQNLEKILVFNFYKLKNSDFSDFRLQWKCEISGKFGFSLESKIRKIRIIMSAFFNKQDKTSCAGLIQTWQPAGMINCSSVFNNCCVLSSLSLPDDIMIKHGTRLLTKKFGIFVISKINWNFNSLDSCTCPERPLMQLKR